MHPRRPSEGASAGEWNLMRQALLCRCSSHDYNRGLTTSLLRGERTAQRRELIARACGALI